MDLSGLRAKQKYLGGMRMKKRVISTTKVFVLSNNFDSKNVCQSLPLVMVIVAACYSYKLAVSHSDSTQ